MGTQKVEAAREGQNSESSIAVDLASHVLFPSAGMVRPKEESTLENVINRLSSGCDVPALVKFLSEDINGADFTSLMLTVYQNRLNALQPRDIIRDYKASRFAAPNSTDACELHEVEQIFLNLTRGNFRSIELSPLMPFGSNSVLTPTDIKKVVIANRGLEVQADATVSLALEIARNRQELLKGDQKDSQSIDLCTHARSVRAQHFEKKSKFLSHFKVFAACSGGRDEGHETFHIGALTRHMRIYLEALKELPRRGYSLRDITVELSHMGIIESVINAHGIDRSSLTKVTGEGDDRLFDRMNVPFPSISSDTAEVPDDVIEAYKIQQPMYILRKFADEVIQPLSNEYPEVHFSIRLNRIAGLGYYPGACCKILARNDAGLLLPLVDGGFTNWTRQLLGNNKEVLFTSGFGTELFVRNFVRNTSY